MKNVIIHVHNNPLMCPNWNLIFQAGIYLILALRNPHHLVLPSSWILGHYILEALVALYLSCQSLLFWKYHWKIPITPKVSVFTMIFSTCISFYLYSLAIFWILLLLFISSITSSGVLYRYCTFFFFAVDGSTKSGIHWINKWR